MELVEKYRKIVLQVFREHTEGSIAHGDLEDEIIVDREADHYLWNGQRIPEAQTDSRLYRPH